MRNLLFGLDKAWRDLLTVPISKFEIDVPKACKKDLKYLSGLRDVAHLCQTAGEFPLI